MSDYCIDISEQSGVRYLHFGSEWVQGAMRIARPVDLELHYTREMMAGLLMHQEQQWPRNILLIGLGAASLTKFCYWRLPQARITVVEISPAVVATAQQYFKLPQEDERLNIHIGDGVDFILNDKKHYDYLLIDAYDDKAQVGVFESRPFYEACWARLSDQGLLAANLFSNNRRFYTSAKHLDEAFEGRSVTFPSCDSGNSVAFAARGDQISVSAVQLRERAETLQKETGLDLRKTVTKLEQAQTLKGGVLVL